MRSSKLLVTMFAIVVATALSGVAALAQMDTGGHGHGSGSAGYHASSPDRQNDTPAPAAAPAHATDRSGGAQHAAQDHSGGEAGRAEAAGDDVPVMPGDELMESVKIPLTAGEVPGGGDEGAAGSAWLMLSPVLEEVCFIVKSKGLEGELVALHIHRAPAGQDGPHHIDLIDGAAFTGFMTSGCAEVGGHGGHGGGPASGRERVQAVIDSPQDYYLNLHSSAYPDGALRGQLG